MSQPRQLSVAASDGYMLATRLFEPPTGAPKGVLIISAGAAFPQRAVARFASYCATRGLATLTYDYRGIAASAPADLARFDARMRDWALLDLTGIIAWAGQEFAQLPLLYAGHSFGGHALGLNPYNSEISRALLVASMSGYWGNFTGAEGWRAFIYMNVVAPPVLAALGYLPGRLGLGEDMSAGIFREWARWCRMKNYFFDDPSLPETENFAQFSGPIRNVAMEDDPWTTPAAVHSLMRHFTNADITYQRHAPKGFGVDKIGHFGFFRPQFQESLWRSNLDWLVSGLN